MNWKRMLVDARQQMPYAREMIAIANAKGKDRKTDLGPKVLQSRCLFFRETIRNYRHISPLLMGMMVAASKIAIISEWLWKRDHAGFNSMEPQLKTLVKRTGERYRVICTE